MSLNKTLWSNEPKTKHFLIPDEEDISSGEYVLRTLSGRQQTVDADLVKKYEISHEDARKWLKSELSDVLGELKTGLGASISQWAKKRSEGSNSSFKTKKNHTTTSTGQPGLELFAALSGESVDSLKTDTVVLGRGLKKISSEISDIFINAIDPDRDKQGDADSQLRALSSTLREHGIPVGEQLEKLPERFRKLYSSSSSTTQEKQASAEKLELLAAEIEEAGIGMAQRLREMAEVIKQQADNSDKDS